MWSLENTPQEDVHTLTLHLRGHIVVVSVLEASEWYHGGEYQQSTQVLGPYLMSFFFLPSFLLSH